MINICCENTAKNNGIKIVGHHFLEVIFKQKRQYLNGIQIDSGTLAFPVPSNT